MTRRLTPDERRLWSRVARTVRPTSGRVIEEEAEAAAPAAPAASKPPTAGAGRQAASAKPRRISPPDDLSGQRRIRRGQNEIDARIDLHGHTQDTAHREVVDFILRQARLGARCVLVITGKGLSRGDRDEHSIGILRQKLPLWISLPPLRGIVLKTYPAIQRDGGTGAWYLYLKRQRDY